MDIREAMSTRRLLSQLDAMDDTIDAMEKLNNTLRAQRHDFLNHLQVVYSPEPPAEPEPLEEPSPGRRAVPASVSWVPSCAGLMMAGAVVRELVK